MFSDLIPTVQDWDNKVYQDAEIFKDLVQSFGWKRLLFYVALWRRSIEECVKTAGRKKGDEELHWHAGRLAGFDAIMTKVEEFIAECERHKKSELKKQERQEEINNGIGSR